jgi:hypothetical protein
MINWAYGATRGIRHIVIEQFRGEANQTEL